MPKQYFSYLDDFDTSTLYKLFNYLVDKSFSPVKRHSRHDDELLLYINDILYDRYCDYMSQWGL